MSEGPGTPTWPQAEAARPSWDSLPRLVRRTIDLKLVVAVLIGLVSVTGAVVAWQSSLSGEKATDKDRQAVAETVVVSQADADNEIIVQDARSRFADHAVAVVTATQLEQQAARFESSGDADSAAIAADEAAEQRAIAQRVLDVVNAPVALASYIDDGPDGSTPAFDESRLRDDLERISGDRLRVNPSQTVREANRLRAESQRLDGWLIAMVAAVVVLTLAQVSRARPVRLLLAGAGTAVWIVSSVLALGS